MADFNEQVKLISGLREKCRQCDESLYHARVNLHRTELQLQRAKQKQTIVDSNRDAQIAAVRARLDRLNSRLAKLREDERQLAEWFAELAEQQRLLEHLQQNLEACRGRIQTLRRQLAELRQLDPPPADRITALENELEKLQRTQSDIEASLEKVTGTINRLEDDKPNKRQRQEELNTGINALREDLRGDQGSLTELLQPAFKDVASLDSRKAEISASIERSKSDCGDCEGELTAAIKDIYRLDPHPRVSLAHLDDRIPFLLLPVRIETIFVPVQGTQTELWVRVYPDDIAIHTHEKTLSDREVLAGELYWTELLAAEHLGPEKDVRRRSAWRHPVELFGGQRAAWIARQTKPSDFDALAAAGAAQSLPDLLRSIDSEFFNELLALDLTPATRTALQNAIAANDGDAFSRLADFEKWFDRINAVVRQRINGFPVHDLTKTDAWTRAPRTNVLPDRFVLLLYGRDAATPREITGNVIPDTMFVGPDPMEAELAFEKKDNVRLYGDAFNWMSDFDKAVEQGMGFRVSLSAEESRNGFAKIVVLGVLLSADAKESAGMLEELIDNHQFGPKGFSIVRQGTPTNNTERDGTGYSDNDAYDDLAFFTATDPPAFDPVDADPRKSRTDGRLLADALGIGYSTMQTVQRADQTDALEAYAMGTALFPGTWGYWLRNWMAPVVESETARQARAFFTRFVSGRGPLPAVRVGNQPYGVLLTSDFSRWKYPSTNNPLVRVELFGNQIAFLKGLHKVLLGLEKIWGGIANALPFVGKPGSDSMEVLIDVLGLHPTSVEFFQRIGFSEEYLRTLLNFTGKGRYAGELNSMLLGMPAFARFYLKGLGIERDDTTVRGMKSIHILWQHYTTALDVPSLVENKPPSETNTLTFDYVDWLAKTEDTQKLINQTLGAKPPSNLLYLMMRNALLLQLHHGAYEWLDKRATLDGSILASTSGTTLLGMRDSLPAISKLEIMGTHVGAVEPAHPTPGVSVADWIWHGPNPTEVEAAFVKEQKAALLNLSNIPTARLERCLVEHIDCCTYRLDAWQTGLFAQRLQAQRSSAGAPQDRQTGVHLGAYGWVEDVNQSPKVFLRPDDLPASLRPADTHPVLEEDSVVAPSRSLASGFKQGGFVHAPSLSHAGAAALLRNAYLSHANPDQAEMFSVNLSSERVRRAEFILEGMRNGQPIEALLGYQFERNLHDRTSASAARNDVPVLEFNQFILPYRQAFPFESREIAQAGTGAPAETVPPYSVVNGLKLLQATLTPGNGFGLATVLPVAQLPNATHGDGILAEQNALLDTLDAVKDLLMAENAFQLVRGNFDRVAAVSLAQKDAHVPSELEVIKTPRGSEFTFTNRVTIHFANLDAALASSNPWPAIAMTPRAIAEPGMNHWLGSIFGPAPENIRCEVSSVETTTEGKEILHDPHLVTLADLGIQPIDFVALVAISLEGTQGATELETRVAFQYRRAHGISDDKVLRITFDPKLAAGQMTFAEIFPLARHLRALLLESRALNAEDFLPAAGGKDTDIPRDKSNPKGYDLPELRARVEGALNALIAIADAIDGPAAPSIEIIFIKDPDNPADDETFVGKLGDGFTKLEEARLAFTDAKQVSINFSVADAEVLHQKLRSIANFGYGDAFPPESDLTIDSGKIAVLARAYRTARRLRRKDSTDGIIDRGVATLSKATADKSIEAQVLLLLETGKILFGETCNWLPKFSCPNEIDLATASGDRDQLLAHAVATATKTEVIDEWLTGLARVMRPLHRFEVVRTLADALCDFVIDVLPVQVPYRAKDSWLAVAFPEKDPNDANKPFGISRDTLSIAAHGSTAFQAGEKQSGILIADWTEEIPTENETTGIAFRYNQPNATPPQLLLLAITPEETGSWNWDDLVGTLNDTLQRAKQRAVEPAQLEKQGSAWNAFMPALISEFSTIQQSDVWLDLMGMLDFKALEDFNAKRIVTP
jgi:archaellum component FlaC